MKKILLSFSLILLLQACGSVSREDNSDGVSSGQHTQINHKEEWVKILILEVLHLM